MFDAFDPAGFVSLDKPPVGFWLQTASAWFFGFGKVSVLLPQVVEGVASVALLYGMVRPRFGAVAGLLAALFLALTPLSVAVDRSNNTESCLVLVLLLAAWTFCRAVETGKIMPLLLAATLVGIGFNVKMLVAFGAVPAFAFVYLAGAPGSPWRRATCLAAAAIVLAPVALSWSLAYELTPPEDRPFVDSTQDNSMLELVVGHNFVRRFVRRADAREHVASGAAANPSAVPPGRDYAPAGPLRLAAPRRVPCRAAAVSERRGAWRPPALGAARQRDRRRSEADRISRTKPRRGALPARRGQCAPGGADHHRDRCAGHGAGRFQRPRPDPLG